MTSSGRNLILPGINGPRSRTDSQAEGVSGTIRKREKDLPHLTKKNSDVEELMRHRREKGELPSLLNRSVRVEPDAENMAKKRHEISVEIKPSAKNMARLQQDPSNRSILSRELNQGGVSVFEDNKGNDTTILRALVEQKEKDRMKIHDELDEKMVLWNNIINQRKRIYNKMIQEINAGHAGELEGDVDYKKRKLAKKAALNKKMQKGVLESRVKTETTANVDDFENASIEQYSTPEDFLNSQITAIFNGNLQNVALIDYRKLNNYISAFETVKATKKKNTPFQRDVAHYRNVVETMYQKKNENSYIK